MQANEKFKFTMLDGSKEDDRKATEAFLSTLTEEEKRRAISSEFDYLDEEVDED